MTHMTEEQLRATIGGDIMATDSVPTMDTLAYWFRQEDDCRTVCNTMDKARPFVWV